jgi:ADP-heptose:LPS heptosyltransferase
MSGVIRLVSWGGIGDAVLATPAVRSLRQAHRGTRIEMHCVLPAHREVFLHNPHLDRLLLLSDRRAAVARFVARFRPRRFGVLNYGRVAPSLLYDKPAACIIGDLIETAVDDPTPEVFLTSAEEEAARRALAFARCPVLIQITSRCNPNQSWAMDKWASLVARNPDLEMIQVGLGDESAIPGAIDWRGRTSIRQAMALVKAARAFVGIISGLAHVAAAVRTPAVVLFGPSNPEIWGHHGNVNIYQPPPCAPCIDVLMDRLCPYGAPCLSSISVDTVHEALGRQLTRQAPAVRHWQ